LRNTWRTIPPAIGAAIGFITSDPIPVSHKDRRKAEDDGGVVMSLGRRHLVKLCLGHAHVLCIVEIPRLLQRGRRPRYMAIGSSSSGALRSPQQEWALAPIHHDCVPVQPQVPTRRFSMRVSRITSPEPEDVDTSVRTLGYSAIPSAFFAHAVRLSANPRVFP
jgi:hypothetical protein